VNLVILGLININNEKYSSMKILGFIIIPLVLLGVGCNNVWTGTYYPEGCLVCDDMYIYSPPFQTSNECIDWAKDLKNELGDEEALYECGLNCENNGYGLYICDETVD